jgi:hypothetical protein
MQLADALDAKGDPVGASSLREEALKRSGSV